MKVRNLVCAALIVALFLPAALWAHCQIPCGIYDDAARVTAMFEDTKTIGKAIIKIRELAGANDATSANQLARWVMNKEEHASHIITVMTEYFLAQRVKPVAPGEEGRDAYLAKLAEHHAVIVAAMKTKQDADPATVQALTAALDGIKKYYKAEEHAH
jgi:nickel superoxide dismutase